MAEVLKHAAIADRNFWFWLQANIAGFRNQDQAFLMAMIENSLDIKARIVLSDYQEQGIRKVLNFGHTFAHALEKVTNYQVEHGEAVAIGMVYEAYVSHLMGILAKDSFYQLKQGLERFGFAFNASYCDDFSRYLLRCHLIRKMSKVRCI